MTPVSTPPPALAPAIDAAAEEGEVVVVSATSATAAKRDFDEAAITDGEGSGDSDALASDKDKDKEKDNEKDRELRRVRKHKKHRSDRDRDRDRDRDTTRKHRDHSRERRESRDARESRDFRDDKDRRDRDRLPRRGSLDAPTATNEMRETSETQETATGTGTGIETSSSSLSVKPQEDESTDAAIEISFGDEEEERRLIEERRKRRQAFWKSIHRLHRLNNEPVNMDSPLVLEQTHSTNDKRESSPGTAAEVSAADYDPNQDGAYDEQHRHKRGAVEYCNSNNEKGKKKSKAAADEFDMFAEILESAVVIRTADNPALIDNWDDPEGYYRIILGEVLDNRYHVYQNLGKGVFSGVVRARDTKDGDRDVAIKVIRNNDTMYRAGTRSEDKKHVIRLERHFEHKGHLCMVFEMLSMNLREVLKKFGKDIGNILHADIKPDNILVTESKNSLKLCDLGSASDASENEITPYLVSRFYRAPEIILGLQYDFSMDMWSIACTLYELYTGKILFPGRSNNHMLKVIQEKGSIHKHAFDDNFQFLSVESDKVTGKDVVGRDLKGRLVDGFGGDVEERKVVEAFVDLLEKCLALDPAKRLTVQEAMVHPFVRPVMG
ncbi:kinase-like protein [Rhizoclosmatium globosum]|uniref:Kinase-like protein n=1 Tax=Rhizoclosmatium globosum TaxID=329046 RepID=A0A1Y2CZ94_9FUNG|nr:kinase-like protein [Rhizoclosmatium globosum]|eukprot:ORY52353.1 kinase-like protein [Rhizoclosmatium globosum]